METKCKKCPICGSEEIHSISISEDENGNIIHKYKCDSCDSYFSSNNSNHKENKANAINSLNFNINKEAFINKTISPKDIFEQDIKYTVELYCKYENECVSTGTGIIITNQYIITNAHVVMYNHEYFKNVVE